MNAHPHDYGWAVDVDARLAEHLPPQKSDVSHERRPRSSGDVRYDDRVAVS